MEKNKQKKSFFIGSNCNATLPVPKFSKYPGNICYTYKESDEKCKKVGGKVK